MHVANNPSGEPDYEVSNVKIIKHKKAKMNYRHKIMAKLKKQARYFYDILPFYFDGKIAHIDNSLLEDPWYKNYDGYISIDLGKKGDRLVGNPNNSRIVKYIGDYENVSGFSGGSDDKSLNQSIKDGFAIEVFGDEKEGFIEYFVDKFRDKMEEYLEEETEERRKEGDF